MNSNNSKEDSKEDLIAFLILTLIVLLLLGLTMGLFNIKCGVVVLIFVLALVSLV